MSDTLDYLTEHLPAWHALGSVPAGDWRELAGRVNCGAATLREVAGSIAELARTGDTGLVGTYAINEICHRLIGLTGAEDLRAGVRDGAVRLALAITETGAGSDIAALRTAVDPATGTLSGEKVYISNSAVADYHIIAARSGHNGQFPLLSLFLVESARLVREDMHGVGAELMRLGRVRVSGLPVADTRLLGRPGRGFRYLNLALDFERAVICVMAVHIGAAVQRVVAQRLRDHAVFGRRLAEDGYHRHTFAGWAARQRTLGLACEAMIDRFDRGEASVPDIFALKVESSRYVRELVTHAQHLFGAAGWVRDGPLSTVYDDTRWFALGGGADELLLSRIAQEDLEAG